jgi:hypothetical protein
LAESLALVGSHPKALTSCSFGKTDATAVLAVREILSQADWVQWASLNDLLLPLAEAASREFLEAVENALNSDPCPFDTVFAQESSGSWVATTWPAYSGRMWLTGFDAPSLCTMDVDKPVRGNGIMQAIARVNCVFRSCCA